MDNANEVVRGDSKEVPDRGTSTGVTDTYGAELGGDATNSSGRLTGTRSDPVDQCKTKDQRI